MQYRLEPVLKSGIISIILLAYRPKLHSGMSNASATAFEYLNSTSTHYIKNQDQECYALFMRDSKHQYETYCRHTDWCSYDKHEFSPRSNMRSVLPLRLIFDSNSRCLPSGQKWSKRTLPTYTTFSYLHSVPICTYNILLDQIKIDAFESVFIQFDFI